MKKITIILTILLIPLFLTGCTKKDSPSETEPVSGVSKEEVKEEGALESFKGSLMDLLNTGRSVKCTAKYVDVGGGYEATTYVSGKNSYSEYILDVEGEKVESYSIINGDWMYTWGDMLDGGSKMNMSEMEKMAEEMGQDIEENKKKAAQYQKEFDYKCRPWIADSSKFQPPADVEFTDMTQMFRDIKESMDNMDIDAMKQSACSACDMLGDATKKAECKANLECK